MLGVVRRAAGAGVARSQRTLRAPAPQRGRDRGDRPLPAKHFDRPVDHELIVTLQAGDLPFPLRPLLNFESVYRNPVEWSGTMPEMDWIVTGRTAHWLLREPSTARENMDIDWRFRVGDVVKLRLVNDRSALHAMQHPIHIHGQRFLVLSVNGVANENLVWKDTVLLPTGFVADVLLEVTTRANGCCTVTSRSTSKRACGWCSRWNHESERLSLLAVGVDARGARRASRRFAVA